MKKSSSLSPLVLLGFAAVLAAVVFLGWKLSEPAPPAPAAAPTVATAPKDTPKPAPSTKGPVSAPTEAPPAPTTPQPDPTMVADNAPKTPDQAAREAADFKIGTIIGQEKTPEAVRDKLLLLFPNFTSYEKIAASPHIVNLTGDEDLPRMLPFLKNPLTPPEAMETFFNDMLNRPPQLGWKVLVDLIGTPRHPMRDRAKELMTTIVGEDFGDDAAKWMEGLRTQLKQQGLDLPQDGAAPVPVQQQ